MLWNALQVIPEHPDSSKGGKRYNYSKRTSKSNPRHRGPISSYKLHADQNLYIWKSEARSDQYHLPPIAYANAAPQLQFAEASDGFSLQATSTKCL